MANLFNTQVKWDFQHAPSHVARVHLSQHVQQMGVSGPQPIGYDFDTMLEMSLESNSTQKLVQELRFPLTSINGLSP
jgi:hypothetical protein